MVLELPVVPVLLVIPGLPVFLVLPVVPELLVVPGLPERAAPASLAAPPSQPLLLRVQMSLLHQ